jgi:3-deoxy-D-manno-octulosonic-acid transferase
MTELKRVNIKIAQTRALAKRFKTLGGKKHYTKFLGFLKYFKKQVRRGQAW